MRAVTQKKTPFIIGGNVNCADFYEKQYRGSFQK